MNRARRMAFAVSICFAALATWPLALALAQSWPQNPGMGPGSSAPTPSGQSAVCARLENQLAVIDRGGVDPARADQIKRYEDAASRQQFELDRMVAQARRSGCEGSGFFLFGGGQPPQCDALNAQIQRMRANLNKMTVDLQRLQGDSVDRSDQRRAVLIALGQNDCGPQYRAAAAAAARPRGLFESLFGGRLSTPSSSAPDMAPETLPGGGGYRTICVRTCDGYYFPISFSTAPAKFQDDEQTCQRLCPASEVVLFSHRNPGEDVSQAVSLAGRAYRELPNAFRYRSEFNAACSCKRPGQTWAEALGDKDATIERGDIVVTTERAKTMSQPRPDPTRTRQDARKKGATPAESAPAANAPAPATESPEAKRAVRNVGPSHYPTR